MGLSQSYFEASNKESSLSQTTTYIRYFIGFLYNYRSIISERSNYLSLLLLKVRVGKTFIRNPKQPMSSLKRTYLQDKVAR